MFREYQDKEQEANTATLTVDILAEEEIRRKKWCIEQANLVEDVRPNTLISLADSIYAYVWGVKQ